MAMSDLCRLITILCIIECTCACTLNDIKVYDFSLTNINGVTQFNEKKIFSTESGNIFLKFKVAAKEFEFALQRNRVFTQNTVVRIINDVSFPYSYIQYLIILFYGKKEK